MSIWSGDRWCDHEYDNLQTIKNNNVKSIIEFGCGVGTKLFLDNCDNITSVEFYTKDKTLAKSLKISSDEWMLKCKEKYKKYTNWNPILIELTDKFIMAEKDITGKTLGLPRGSNPLNEDYLVELGDIIDEILYETKYDMGFVDAGVHFRGDIVNVLFNKIDIITVHDVNNRAHGGNIYGYLRIKCPKNYEHKKGIKSVSGLSIYKKK